MTEKVVNSSFVLLSKFVASRQESASKSASSPSDKTLLLTHISKNVVILFDASKTKCAKKIINCKIK